MTKILDLDGLTHYDTLLKDYINTVILENDQRKHPIGSLEFNVSGTNPNTYLGFGTWELWGSGKVPVGVDTTQTEFNTVEKTGGSKYMQKHSHTRGTMNITGSYTVTSDSGSAGLDANGSGTGAIGAVTSYGYGSSVDPGSGGWILGGCFDFDASRSWTGATSEEGTGDSGNLQPYITCYMWKRVS